MPINLRISALDDNAPGRGDLLQYLCTSLDLQGRTMDNLSSPRSERTKGVEVNAESVLGCTSQPQKSLEQ